MKRIDVEHNGKDVAYVAGIINDIRRYAIERGFDSIDWTVREIASVLHQVVDEGTFDYREDKDE